MLAGGRSDDCDGKAVFAVAEDAMNQKMKRKSPISADDSKRRTKLRSPSFVSDPATEFALRP